jgi:hypothetical protein
VKGGEFVLPVILTYNPEKYLPSLDLTRLSPPVALDILAERKQRKICTKPAKNGASHQLGRDRVGMWRKLTSPGNSDFLT